MRWNVEGADSRTGKDRLVTIEADDERSAEQIARDKGMLIAAVHAVRVLTPAEKLEQMMAGKLDASTVTTIAPPTAVAPEPIEQLAAEWNAQVTERKAELAAEAIPEEPKRHRADDVTTSTLFTSVSGESEDRNGAGKIGLNYRAVLPRLFAITRQDSVQGAPDYAGLRIAGSVLAVLAVLAYLAGVLSTLATVITLFNGYWPGRGFAGFFAVVAVISTSMTPLVIGAVLHGLSAGCLALRDIARNSFSR